MFGRSRSRDREVAAYVRALDAHNGRRVGAAETARLSRRDGRDYTEAEVSRIRSDMGRGQL